MSAGTDLGNVRDNLCRKSKDFEHDMGEYVRDTAESSWFVLNLSFHAKEI
jgi:hypothetical protein